MDGQSKQSFLNRLAGFVVDKSIFFLIAFAAITVFCAIMIPKVKVENDMTAFLPKDSETKQALDLMEGKFVSVASFDLMVKNVTLEEAKSLQSELMKITGVKVVNFSESSEQNYKDKNAMYSILLNSDANSSEVAINVKALVSDKEYYSVSLAENTGLPFATEMLLILLIAAVVIVLVLLLTSKSFLEIPVFLIVFIVAAVLNMGTNFILPSVSFVTNSIAVVLQLALAVDYSIIFAHRYIEERKSFDTRHALVNAFSKAIKEVLSSSLTTIAGLVALMLMTLQIGLDLGIVLAKGIVISCLCVFFLMPCLIKLFAKPIDRTLHKNFVPSVQKPVKSILKARYAIASVFLCIVVLCGVLQGNNVYSYEYRTRAQQSNIQQIENVFGKTQSIGVLLQNVDYEVQNDIINKLREEKGVLGVTGIAGIEISGINVTSKVTTLQLVQMFPQEQQAEMLPVLRVIFFQYANMNGEYIVGMNIDEYSVPIIDIMDYAIKLSTAGGAIKLPDEIMHYYELYASTKGMLVDGEYSRILINMQVSDSMEKDFEFMDKLDGIVKEYSSTSLMFGDYSVTKDLSRGFMRDVVMISVLTVVFIFLILLITFRSISLPLILIFAIQGSIFINFSIPALFSTPVFFMSYIIVSAIQMGATIDYAIVVTNRYLHERKTTTDKKQAMAVAINNSFQSIITSGLMLVTAGFLVGTISSNTIISSIGMFLGAGALVSLIVVLFVLPQLLVICDWIIQKTTLKRRDKGGEKIDTQENISDGEKSEPVSCRETNGAESK